MRQYQTHQVEHCVMKSCAIPLCLRWSCVISLIPCYNGSRVIVLQVAANWTVQKAVRFRVLMATGTLGYSLRCWTKGGPVNLCSATRHCSGCGDAPITKNQNFQLTWLHEQHIQAFSSLVSNNCLGVLYVTLRTTSVYQLAILVSSGTMKRR